MNKTIIISLFTILMTNSLHAEASSYQKLICAIEARWTQDANKIYKDTLRNRFVDHYSNIEGDIEPLIAKTAKIVSKNCLSGKHHSEIADELKKLWKKGCEKIVNPSLTQICPNFMALNDGSNVEDKLSESPELKEIFRRAKSSDSVEECSPEVSTSTIQKDFSPEHHKAINTLNTAQ